MSDEMKILKKMITSSLSADEALKISQAILNLANAEKVKEIVYLKPKVED